jgi:hypothetical protein
VRVHTGSEAAHEAERLNAIAFTIGRDIFFSRGHYQPASDGGRRLLAHELTHVVQQATTSDAFAQRQPASPGERQAAIVPDRQPAGPTLSRALVGGYPLDAMTRTMFELRFDQDFRAVRIHDSEPAHELASALDARAFAAGPHIVFGRGRYQPHSVAGRQLLAHELAHVTQQPALPNPGGAQRVSRPDDAVERDAHAFVGSVARGSVPPKPSPVAAFQLLRSPASDFISAHTHHLNLDEEQAGADLLRRALRGEHAFARSVFDELGWSDRDDVAFGFTQAATDAQLDTLVSTPSGRALLDRVYDELTSGSVAEDEQRQSDRILAARGRLVSPAEFQAGIHSAKIFPFRLPGMTVLEDAPISAERRPGNRVWIKLPVHVLGTSEFRAETNTLPVQVFTSGIELPEREIVGVRLYDLGGEIQYRPAIWLVGLSNQTDTTIAEKVGEVAGIALTLGTGALAEAGAGTLSQVLLWADRVAFAVGTITSVLREHRGWILARFGDDGRRFIHYVDIVNSAVAIYGGARVVFGMGQLLRGLRSAYGAWRQVARAAQAELSSTERTAVRTLDDGTGRLLDDFDHLASAQRPAAGEPPAASSAVTPEPAAAPPATERPATTMGEPAPRTRGGVRPPPAVGAARGPAPPTQQQLESYADRAWRFLRSRQPRPAVTSRPLQPGTLGHYESNPRTIVLSSAPASEGQLIDTVWHEAMHGRIRDVIGFMNEHLSPGWQRTLLRPLDEIFSYFWGGLGRVIEGPNVLSRLFGLAEMFGAPIFAYGSMNNRTEQLLWAAHAVAYLAALLYAEVRILTAVQRHHEPSPHQVTDPNAPEPPNPR